MTTLFAQPYDISATGFYFDSHEDYIEKSETLRNEHGDSVEEFEIQFIDGEDIDSELAKAWGLYQGDISAFFDATENWEEHQKLSFIIAVGECFYKFDAETGHPDDFEVDLYQLDDMKDLAEHFIEEGLYGPIPEALQYYIDTDAIARDLSVDYSEITIAGTNYIYACR